ncbi:MAG: aminoacyl-tRNA hydrolase [Actinomycetia bacterium]|nr:aminoacyl-tRNA hydrolase [Actinomycetes bacterium]
MVVGLGNPGSRYAGTRHNVGSDTVALIAARGGERLRDDTKVSASVGDVRIGDVRVRLAVPMTWMNESGLAVSSLVRRHEPDDWNRLVIVHDELDLEPGVVRCKVGGGLAGHNGLRDIDRHLSTRDFARVRIGVGKPPGGAEHGANWVLSRVSGSEREVLVGSVERAADAVETIATDGIDAAMAQFNARS